MEQAIKDKAPKPAGLVPKNLQAFLLVGLALLMVLVMALTGHKRPASPTNPQTSPAQNILPVNADKVTDFQKTIEQAQRESAPQAEEALLQRQRQLAAQGMGSAQPFPSTPYGTTTTSAYPNGAYPPGAYATGSPQPAEGSTDPIKDEQKKRTYMSLFSDNVALTYRKELRVDPGRNSSMLAVPDQLTNQANAELAHGEEILAEAQKAGLVPQTPVANSLLPNAASPQSAADSFGQKSADPKTPDAKAPDPSGANQSAEGKKYVLFEGTVLEALLTFARRFFLKDTGRKLAHFDRELNAGRTPMPPHLHREELT